MLRHRRRPRPSDGSPRRPSGRPVEPEVKMIHASSSTVGGGDREIVACSGAVARPRTGRRLRVVGGRPATIGAYTPPSPMTPRTRASPNTSRARSSGSSASTGTYAAPAARMPRIETYSSFEPEATRTPTRSPRRTPDVVQARGGATDERHQLAVAQRAGAVVERGGLGVPCRRRAKDVDERAGRRSGRRAVEDALGGRGGHLRRGDRRAGPSSAARSPSCPRREPAPAAARR